MHAMETNKGHAGNGGLSELPIGFVPTPTQDYREHRKTMQATVEPGRPTRPSPIPIPIPVLSGPRVLIWKQDPSVREIGVRKAYIPSFVANGPRDARIRIKIPPNTDATVSKNAMGDFVETPGSEEFDYVHTFSVVRQTLTMYERACGGLKLPWQWNGTGNMEPLSVFPRAGVTANAYYSRSQKALRFFYFTPPGATGHMYTCRSLDIVAHETGHAILDALKPKWLPVAGNPPQTGGLHESFGDLTAVFLALSQLDQVEAIIAQTKANLHNKTFLADLAEQFGLALGRPNGLRNADNDLKLSQTGNEVHAISQVFTGAIYDIMADIFQRERRWSTADDARVLYEVGRYMCSLVLRALIQAPDERATYADVANRMLRIAAWDGKPAYYRNFIRNQFVLREVVLPAAPLPVSATAVDVAAALAEDMPEGVELAANVTDAPGAIQDRSACCGTMQLDEYTGTEDALQGELDALQKFLKKGVIAEAATAFRYVSEMPAEHV